MNKLETKLHKLIETDGPISVALYMALCLNDPDDGYYMRHEAFGAKGDFITAPEISQLFGEILGVYLALCLDRLEANKPVMLVELGPGRGTLMADILRTIKQLRPQYFQNLQVALVETSPRLRRLQMASIQNLKVPALHDTIASLPDDTALLVVGNEFLDALPVHQYVKSGTQWRERMVTVDNGKLSFTLGAATLRPEELPTMIDPAANGAVFEIAPAREATVQDLAIRIKAQGGAALLIDYGHRKSGYGDTLQAMRAHHYTSVLETPGDIDLTSHIDFQPLEKAAIAAGCKVSFATQGAFLLNYGLLERAGALGTGKSAAYQAEIQAAVERLAGPKAMGDLFKVLCFGRDMPDLPDGAHA